MVFPSTAAHLVLKPALKKNSSSKRHLLEPSDSKYEKHRRQQEEQRLYLVFTMVLLLLSLLGLWQYGPFSEPPDSPWRKTVESLRESQFQQLRRNENKKKVPDGEIADDVIAMAGRMHELLEQPPQHHLELGMQHLDPPQIDAIRHEESGIKVDQKYQKKLLDENMEHTIEELKKFQEEAQGKHKEEDYVEGAEDAKQNLH